jgi:hypothetical protein
VLGALSESVLDVREVDGFGFGRVECLSA